ncbi:MAG: anti-sigma factor domain-containing protein [Actinomycetota bacterium]
MTDHASIEELIALHSLDGLDPSGERELAEQRAEHGATCQECLRLESTYDEVAGRLAFAVEPAEIDDGFEDRVVALARGGQRAEAGDDEPSSIAPEGDHRRFTTSVRAVAGLVAAALIVAAAIGGYLLAPRQDTTAQALEGLLKRHDVQRVELNGAANGTMNVYYAPEDPNVFLVGSGLDEPPSGKAYELWMFRGNTPVSGGCFTPEEGDVLHEVDADLSGATAMAITVEPDACPSAPTTSPVMSGPI